MLFQNKLLLALLSSLAIGSLAIAQEELCAPDSSACTDLNNNCKCYCSKKCGPRDKTPEDAPVSKDGICFCQPWDLQYYESRCGVNASEQAE